MNPYLRLIRFDKPIGTLLLLWPTLWGLWIAYGGIPPLTILIVFVLGVFLTRAAGCAINDFADAEFDRQVKRTIMRPVAANEISRKSALLVCFILSVTAFCLAAMFLQSKTLFWTIPALLIFVSYPFFKRFFPIPQLYLSIAFSFGIPMAFIEAGMGITLSTWAIFAANCVWVLAYDTIYAMVDLDDDLKIGIKTSAITFGSQVIPVIASMYLALVGLLIYLQYSLHLGVFFVLSIIVSIRLIDHIYLLIKPKRREDCFKAFLFNNYIGMIIFAGLFFSYIKI